MDQSYYIGCSGYYYSYWKNRFYPKGLQSKNWLQYYSSVFNTVELNSTFYRVPKLSDLKKYVMLTPDDFKFSVKMNQSISHINKLKESKQEIADFQELIQDGLNYKLNYFLFQMPPSFQFNEENLERIIQNIPHTTRNVIEFRHISWWNQHTEHALKNATLTFCNVNYPGLDTYLIQTSPAFYMRLHGNPELFKSAYTKEELKTLYDQFPENCHQYNIYFNNTYYEAGYTNALELKELIKHA